VLGLQSFFASYATTFTKVATLLSSLPIRSAEAGTGTSEDELPEITFIFGLPAFLTGQSLA